MQKQSHPRIYSNQDEMSNFTGNMNRNEINMLYGSRQPSDNGEEDLVMIQKDLGVRSDPDDS